jgi:hypothetical protein
MSGDWKLTNEQAVRRELAQVKAERDEALADCRSYARLSAKDQAERDTALYHLQSVLHTGGGRDERGLVATINQRVAAARAFLLSMREGSNP